MAASINIKLATSGSRALIICCPIFLSAKCIQCMYDFTPSCYTYLLINNKLSLSERTTFRKRSLPMKQWNQLEERITIPVMNTISRDNNLCLPSSNIKHLKYVYHSEMTASRNRQQVEKNSATSVCLKILSIAIDTVNN